MARKTSCKITDRHVAVLRQEAKIIREFQDGGDGWRVNDISPEGLEEIADLLENFLKDGNHK